MFEDFKFEVDSEKPVNGIVEKEFVRKFLLGGNCHCNIENMRTGNNFTYKIQRAKDKRNMYFVNVLSGLGDIYLGYFYVNANLIDYRKGEKGNADENDQRVQVLVWTLTNHKRLPSYVIVEHFGKCSVCGAPLSDADSSRRGYCSTCALMI